jgi:hypothetical protein
MKIFYIELPVLQAEGTQCFSVRAETEEQALKIFERDGGEFVDDEIEVKHSGKPYVTSSEEDDEEDVWK